MLCDSLEGWNGGGGRDAQMGGDICIFMADSCFLQWKPTQHYKAIILQLKINLEKKTNAIGEMWRKYLSVNPD